MTKIRVYTVGCYYSLTRCPQNLNAQTQTQIRIDTTNPHTVPV